MKLPSAPDGAQLLAEIREFISRYVVLPSEEVADLLALWVLHSHAFEASWATPYLRVVSATPDSGKTLLLEVLASVCRKGWHAVNPSTAVLYRKVDRDQPTLLLDEMDNYPLEDRKDALSVLNSGYKRGARVSRCKENGDLEDFYVFCPKAYAGLDDRQLVPTLLSRSITIRMQTKLASEEVGMWIAPDVEEPAGELRERCTAWADQNTSALSGRRPDLLGLHNRKAEVWWALLAIGEQVGGEWQESARSAARALGAGGDGTDSPAPQLQLLLDIRAAFGGERTIFTDDLLAYLNGLDESPWGARRRGEGLDPRGLAHLLRPFKVKPKKVRVAERVAKGYHIDQFGDAFARYVPEGEHGATRGTSPPQSQANVPHVPFVAPSERADGSDADDGSVGISTGSLPDESNGAPAPPRVHIGDHIPGFGPATCPGCQEAEGGLFDGIPTDPMASAPVDDSTPEQEAEAERVRGKFGEGA